MMRFIQKAFLMFCAAALSLSAPVSTFASETEGPGAIEEYAEEPVSDAADAPLSVVSLGTYRITGYCGCEKCSGGHTLTSSGTVPTANHTISADLSQLPLGTRLMINGLVYTVEDEGSSVRGNVLDIYYDSHEEALANGVFEAEVFLLNE